MSVFFFVAGLERAAEHSKAKTVRWTVFRPWESPFISGRTLYGGGLKWIWSLYAHSMVGVERLSLFCQSILAKTAKVPRFSMKKRKTGGFLRLVGNSHLFATVVIYFAHFGRRHVGDRQKRWENDEILLSLCCLLWYNEKIEVYGGKYNDRCTTETRR